MSQTQAWRFLVSRNQYLDYRTVVAPDFMCKANETSLLAKTAEGDINGEIHAYSREIYGSKSGDLTIIYRVVEAKATDLVPGSEGTLKDSFGREICLIEGVVLKGIHKAPGLTLNFLDLVHCQLAKDYQDFWEWIVPQPAISSEALAIEATGHFLEYRSVTRYIASSSSASGRSTLPTDSEGEQLSLVEKFNFSGEIYFSRFIDDSRILVHQYRNEVTLLDVTTKEKVELIKGGTQRYIHRVSLNTKSGSTSICTANIVGADFNAIKVLNLDGKIKGEEKDIGDNGFGPLNRINAIAFSFDGVTVACSENSNLLSSLVPIKFIDSKGGGTIGEKLPWHTSTINCIEPSPLSSDVFASGDGQGFVRLWNWRSMKRLGSLPAHPNKPVNCIAFSPNKKIIVSGGDDGKIAVLSYSKELTSKGFLGETGQYSDWVGGVNALAFSPDGRKIASGGDDGRVSIWDLKSKQRIYESPKHSNKAIMSICFSPNGEFLISGSKDKVVSVWKT
ncbi:hypothetical protein IQ254_16970 [Nodosilinea sp. LEGE 07088]|uniref:WD40 repeat domain-containing protein n=1 Tax=Nodosilinea sp. LEGE 07088 TaxID=2777968 RepID=UPI001882D8FE|nr:hypothetical protein [Nodosilinea sp. LEGE 07088]MBE9138866.1 hypothetical protein [Nodosilinea sp. LEGE 07088]